MIWLAAGVLLVLALLGVGLPWWSARFMRPRGVERRDTNVALYRERLAQLPVEIAAGTLSAEAAEELKAELAARLLSDASESPAPGTARVTSQRWLPFAASVLLVVFALGTYLWAGSWRTQALIELSRTDPAAAERVAIERMVGELEARVKKVPDDADSWLWLARSYRGHERLESSLQAFERANTIKGGQDPDLLAEWGETLALSQGHKLAGGPAEKFAQALTVAPEHPRALLYAGAAAMQAGDDRSAVGFWERLLKTDLPADMRAPLEARIAELRQSAGMPPAPKATAVVAGPIALRVRVTLSPAMQKLLQPTDRIFVYAAEQNGPPMPLAVQTFAGSQLPPEVTLTDADSPMPTRKLSSVDRWRVVARVSKSGNATPQSGDLEGSVEVERAQTGDPVSVSIDRIR